MSETKRDAFTQIPNGILDALSKAPLNGTQFQIVMFVLRSTMGYGHGSRSLSCSYIASGTGKSLRGVKKEIGRLLEMRILSEISRPTVATKREVYVNSNVDNWLITGEQSFTSEQSFTGEQSCTRPVNNSAPVVVNNPSPKQIKRVNKDIKYNVVVSDNSSTPTQRRQPEKKDVVNFCRQNNLVINPDRFYAYYAALEWKRQNGEPVDWRAAALAWDKKDRASGSNGAAAGGSGKVTQSSPGAQTASQRVPPSYDLSAVQGERRTAPVYQRKKKDGE